MRFARQQFASAHFRFAQGSLREPLSDGPSLRSVSLGVAPSRHLLLLRQGYAEFGVELTGRLALAGNPGEFKSDRLSYAKSPPA